MRVIPARAEAAGLAQVGRAHKVRTRRGNCMDGFADRQHHALVRVLPHVKMLDHSFGDFLVRVSCQCGTSRHIEPEALARIAGRSVTLAKLASRMRCSNCGRKVAEVVAVARPRPRGGGRSPPK